MQSKCHRITGDSDVLISVRLEIHMPYPHRHHQAQIYVASCGLEFPLLLPKLPNHVPQWLNLMYYVTYGSSSCRRKGVFFIWQIPSRQKGEPTNVSREAGMYGHLWCVSALLIDILTELLCQFKNISLEHKLVVLF